MSVFSLIKRGRAQAKEHNAKQAERAKEEAVKLPYRHVVTHAASDALSGAPSSWKHVDRQRIMEQNKRRTAMANDHDTAGLPRVGSSLPYVPYASVYGTPVVPLPKNYSYSNIPSAWRDQLGNSNEGPDYFAQLGSGRSAKGKEPQYIRTPASLGPASRFSLGQSSILSSKGVSHDGSIVNLSSSDDELEMKTRITTNRRPQSLTFHPSVSQQSTTSSEKPYHTPLTSAGTVNEPAAKIDRYYPPRAHSTYFSAPRPLSRRLPPTEAPVAPPSVTERSNSTASSSNNSSHFSTAPSTASIGLAIASLFPPKDIDLPLASPVVEDHIASGRKHKTTTMNESHIESARRALAEQAKTSTDASVTKTSKQAVTPETPPTQKRRRRLSKSKPPTSDGSRISAETVRPRRLSLSGLIRTNSNFDKPDNTIQQKVEEITVIDTSGSMRKSNGKLSKLSKSPGIKGVQQSRKGLFSLRSSSKTPAPAITAH
ncbi:hypothetical protein F5B19DRAFT_113552 [Rostrohypoxylon terebratum]|nr:hypothetical protein F5B19DRAFT_113552 [Rostrohypoxylon terebratum]